MELPNASIGNGNTGACIINGTGNTIRLNDTQLIERLASVIESQAATIERLTIELSKERAKRTARME